MLFNLNTVFHFPPRNRFDYDFLPTQPHHALAFDLTPSLSHRQPLSTTIYAGVKNLSSLLRKTVEQSWVLDLEGMG